LTPDQIKEFRKTNVPGKDSRKKWSKICGVPISTLIKWENGNVRIPELYIKFIELWGLSENQISMYHNDIEIHQVVDTFVDILINRYPEVAEDIVNLVKVIHREKKMSILGFIDNYDKKETR
jgi:hypothetical protein